MEKFTTHTGVAAALLRSNVDTDAIIPSREMKTVSKTGLSAGLFAGWRYLDAATRTPNPEFILNRPEQRGSTILLSGLNFGCGSSREHAPWALADFGIRCVIAGSFGDIFRENCRRNGITLITLTSGHGAVAAACERGETLAIDLAAQVVRTPDGGEHAFAFAPGHEDYATRPLDEIARTLQFEAAIAAYERRLEETA